MERQRTRESLVMVAAYSVLGALALTGCGDVNRAAEQQDGQEELCETFQVEIPEGLPGFVTPEAAFKSALEANSGIRPARLGGRSIFRGDEKIGTVSISQVEDWTFWVTYMEYCLPKD